MVLVRLLAADDRRTARAVPHRLPVERGARDARRRRGARHRRPPRRARPVGAAAAAPRAAPPGRGRRRLGSARLRGVLPAGRPIEGATPATARSLAAMCRNITELRGLQPPATAAEISAAARQYVRKVSGLTKVPAAAEEAFEAAVQEVADSTTRLLAALPSRKQPPPTVPPLRRPEVQARIQARAAAGD